MSNKCRKKMSIDYASIKLTKSTRIEKIIQEYLMLERSNRSTGLKRGLSNNGTLFDEPGDASKEFPKSFTLWTPAKTS